MANVLFKRSRHFTPLCLILKLSKSRDRLNTSRGVKSSQEEARGGERRREESRGGESSREEARGVESSREQSRGGESSYQFLQVVYFLQRCCLTEEYPLVVH